MVLYFDIADFGGSSGGCEKYLLSKDNEFIDHSFGNLTGNCPRARRRCRLEWGTLVIPLVRSSGATIKT
jgi:hypothetical protein